MLLADLPSLGDTMGAAERAQAMLDKHLATGLIVLLGCLVIVLVLALVKTTNARVEDVKAINAGLVKYIEENTRSNIALTRAVEMKLTRRARGSGSQPALPSPKEGEG